MLRSRLPAASRQSRRTLPELPAQRPAAPDLSPSPADLLFNTWPGRLFLVAAALKLLVAVLRRVTGVPGAIELLSSAATIGLMVSVGYFVWRLFLLMKRRLLWRVRRKLILSYIFIGVVPALLIIAFFILGALVISTNVSAYLFRDGYDDMVNYAGLAANAAAAEVGRNPCGRRRDGGARAAECQQRRPAIPPVIDRLRAERRTGHRRSCGPASGVMPRCRTAFLHG